VLLAGYIAYFQAVFAQKSSYSSVMGVSALAVFALAIVVISLGRERRGTTFGSG
jgi:hypothetical protein